MRRFGILLALCSAQAWTQAIPWQGPVFFLTSRQMPLAEVLGELGANYRLPVVVSPAIRDSFSGRLAETHPGEALSTLSRQYQLMPYYDGQALYLYKAEEMDRSVLTPAALPAATLLAQLKDAGLSDAQACRLSLLDQSNALQVAGVPVCLSRLTLMAKQLDSQYAEQAQRQDVVQVYPLRYASAADSSYSFRGQSVLVPGIVSVLRDMTHSPASGTGGAAVKTASGLPVFSADSQRNAVLVRDLAKNQNVYRDLIRQLDHRPTLIEISVEILDVDAADIDQLGVDWQGNAAIGGGAVAFNANTGLSGGSFSSLVSNTQSFLVRLSALTARSRARIISRPSVVTLDNVQAVLDRNITFYTKLASDSNPQLASVSAGELMRVTPRLIHEPDQPERVLLTLNIQDGRQAPPVSEVESLPQVQNAEISTQATLQTGQALLLGGFVENEAVQGERKVPLLGDLPLLGGLFRSKATSGRSMLRLFLIRAEPRAV
ncbi:MULTISPECIES: EscC/YscC/HrcC family type III secretion system outer membrane ring protein [unclassified Paludibacterium]|uniref:EscC/YscC/HrcC family type III secretion system outer membrane ring protein n=1 Tax=unclassified Paludibacterium TaxID=2618429 RepID=UPI00207B6695|nr:EscC/YscC/HrcC family type III secretion system outer membrane ring protein [Paludibacterium sp. B53371]BEV73179.1 EscC/YscC/HrcC family type III secretion system outer membrane ring protein [Paludibacterium sp. THUN1379]